MVDLPVRSVKDAKQREYNWLKNNAGVPLDTVGHVLNAMGQVYRAYMLDYISERNYKLLFAGLKEIRSGREAEETRRVMRDLGMPFVGLTLVGPEPTNGKDRDHDDGDGRA